ncbi:ALG3-domain-containing protein [Ascobolus immersus RN42]|uniref:Dol-P-Man:Man(5)GlcNAc(2)-PP-Dol alpha-1,3-mannosyltransferase n=1 Tax=Ascobolus immersus RN42 TaxID=1160509 RepID=A0A3N4IP36_ASCIM|nr:ALG3-domain-containing protein [Ascobolus immersus RN42]
MTQISQILAGETNYSLIKGSTGPLVYPGVHVHIFRNLYKLTNGGTDVPLAQYIFAGVYILTLLLVLLAHKRAGAPPWILPLLVLSKRLHSIYVLRLFNDCWSVLFMWASILALEYKMWTAGALLWSLSVGVKMSSMLIAPAIAVVLLYGSGGKRALKSAFMWAQLQFILGMPFIKAHPREYLHGAFEFTRQFLYKWTVNWRFIPEEQFLSKRFAYTLLGLHLLVLYIFLFRWARPSRLPISSIPVLLQGTASPLQEAAISARVTPQYILTTILTCNAIGMLFARSLHYQFYSWQAWGTPYLLWRSGLGPVWVVGIWAAQEWAWNVYPSTNASSGVVVAILALQVLGVWFGTKHEDEWEDDPTKVRVEVIKKKV